VITGLLKIATGLSEVNADSYLQQAEAIFAAEPGTQAATPTHPENFIRTRAIRLWQDQREAAEPIITKMIEGLADLDRLDLFSQARLHSLTRDVVQELLRPEWTRTEMVRGLANQYFPGLTDFGAGGADIASGETDIASKETDIRNRLAAALTGAQPSIHDYFSYLLLDFALVDPSLEDGLLGRGLAFAEEAGLSAFEPLCKKELQLGEKKWQQHKRSALSAYQHLQSE